MTMSMVFSFSSLLLAGAGVSSVVGLPFNGIYALALVHAVTGTHAFAGVLICCWLYHYWGP
jgi:hypothetical protein